MRPACLTEAPQQRFVTRFDEDECCRVVAGKGAVKYRELFDLLALARVHQQRCAFNLAPAFVVQLAENGNQRDRKIVHAIETEIFEGF